MKDSTFGRTKGGPLHLVSDGVGWLTAQVECNELPLVSALGAGSFDGERAISRIPVSGGGG